MGTTPVKTFAIIIFGVFFFKTNSAEIIKHELRISYIEGYPDGVYANYILSVNGQFPGPTIEATVGDTLEITVINEIQDGQNVSIHWHGLHQKDSMFEDGVSMITQCPIPSGHQQVYRFNATQAGTYWYHSHHRSQYTEGLYGALIIHAVEEAYDYYGEATLILSDWFHRPARENEAWYLSQKAFGQPPKIDSTLVNGMGMYSCPIALLQNLTCRSRRMRRPVIRVERDQTYRIRVINAAAGTMFNFSLAAQPLNVIEADGVDVAGPVVTDNARISEGQRYSFLVKCPEDSKEMGSRYKMFTQPWTDHIGLEGDGIENINKYADALITYPYALGAVLECTDDDLSGFPGKTEMTSEIFGWIGNPLINDTVGSFPRGDLLNEMDLKPFDGIAAPEHVDEEHMIELTFLESFENDVRTPSINYTGFTYPDDKPLLHKVIAGEDLKNDMTSVEINLGSVVQLVINNEFANPHPFHLHGHHFWVVGFAEGGRFNATRHNLTRDGVKRDTLLVPSFGWAVIRFEADNPGVWLFHCHLDWHAVGGMVMVFQEGVDVLKERYVPTEESIRICNAHKTEQIKHVNPIK